MGVRIDEEQAASRAPDAGQALAAFYDRRAAAALAYCARICPPDAIADAVEAAFGQVFAAAAAGGAVDDEALDRLLREAVREAAAERSPGASKRLVTQAEGAYEALSGDDAPALGRSLLGQMIEDEPFASVEPEVAEPAAVEPEAVEPEPVEPEPRPEAAAEPEAAADEPQRTRRLHLPQGWRRRLMIVLAVLGALLLAEGIVTYVWKEPFTAYLAARAQDDLDKQLDERADEKVAFGESDRRSLAALDSTDARERKRMSLLAARLDEQVPEGEALGRIQIGELGVDFVFVQGTESETLRKGPGHYDGATALPGQGGVVGIAGHRTTYEAPFREVDDLDAGDTITLRMPYGLFTYEVTGSRIVPADYGEAFVPPDGAESGEQLVLSACHPLYSATERILVESKLVSSEPLGSAIETSTSTPAVPAVPGDSPRELARRRTQARLKRLGDRPLVPGLSGPDVRELQRLLGMPVTGTFDANTTAAVLAFQREHDLPQVGEVGPQTKLALARRRRPPSRPPTPAEVPQQDPNDPSANGRSQSTTPFTGPTGATGAVP
jgi:sortase A